MLGGMGQAGAGIKIGMVDSGIDITPTRLAGLHSAGAPGFPKTNAASRCRLYELGR